MRVKFLVLIFLSEVCAFLLAGNACADAVVGEPAPAFEAKTLDGKNFDLSALKGKVVVINFWATWCGACRNEMPALEAAWRHYHSQGLEVLAVSADRPRMRKSVDQVMSYYTYPAATLDAVKKNDLVMLTSVPLTYVIGKDGKVENILTPPLSPLTETGLEDEVKALLEAKPETKSEEKPEAKAETKPEPKSEEKPAEKK